MGRNPGEDEEQATSLLEKDPTEGHNQSNQETQTAKGRDWRFQALLVCYLVTAACYYRLYSTMAREIAQCRKLDLFPCKPRIVLGKRNN